MRELRTRRGVLAVTAIAALAAVTALTACTSGEAAAPPSSSVPAGAASDPVGSSSAPPTSAPPAPARPAVITTNPARHTEVNPTTPIRVAVTGGQLTAVRMTNPTGKVVTGKLSADHRTWTTTEVLGYSKTYTLIAHAVNADGKRAVKTSRFTTVTPDNLTMPYMQRMGGYPLGNGATYGVGIIPVVHFDEPISNKAAAQRALSVTTSPHVAGVWSWTDDQDVSFRPQYFWPAGTKVTINAHVYGVQVGHGLYGESDVGASFTVGRRQITIAHDTAPKSVNKVRVYNAAGKMLRSMNTSMGQHGGVTVNGNYINFYTMGGTYTVLEHDNPAQMCSATYGLPANAPGGYPCEPIYYSSKISVDGVYLHELDTTVWAQDSGQDVSHGCLNLNHDNAVWYYTHSMIGDPVIIHGAKAAPTIQPWQGGDWSVPWSTWLKGSAL
jgi:lipoprotein-anchoring transpeptidase ErfK/SrfK